MLNPSLSLVKPGALKILSFFEPLWASGLHQSLQATRSCCGVAFNQLGLGPLLNRQGRDSLMIPGYVPRPTR